MWHPRDSHVSMVSPREKEEENHGTLFAILGVNLLFHGVLWETLMISCMQQIKEDSFLIRQA